MIALRAMPVVESGTVGDWPWSIHADEEPVLCHGDHLPEQECDCTMPYRRYFWCATCKVCHHEYGAKFVSPDGMSDPLDWLKTLRAHVLLSHEAHLETCK